MKALWRTPLLGPGVFALWRADARRKHRWAKAWIPPAARLVEIGSGPGSVVAVLRDCGHDAVGVDVRDSSYADALAPVLYDGAVLPFADGVFDVALLLTVLHHAHDPEGLIREAARVAPRVIIVEDVYDGPLQEALTKAADSVINFEFCGHPHANRTDAGWRETLERLGLRLRHGETAPLALVFRQALYVADAA